MIGKREVCLVKPFYSERDEVGLRDKRGGLKRGRGWSKKVLHLLGPSNHGIKFVTVGIIVLLIFILVQ